MVISQTGCNIPRLIISALSGGGGKTLLSLGLIGGMRKQGFEVIAFKKGPDYIDAAWLSLASGHAVSNLDPFFLTEVDLRNVYAQALWRVNTTQPCFAVIEGNRGLYDGLDWKGSASTAELARVLHAPILLSVDCTKTTRTIAALLQGMLTFEKDLYFLGIVLNRVGTVRQEKLIREVLGHYCDLPIIGVLPRLKQNYLPERHMGLASFGNTLAEDARQRLDHLAELVSTHLDLKLLRHLMEGAVEANPLFAEKGAALSDIEVGSPCVRIGYLFDAAFWFYYPENLENLQRLGAELVPLNIFGEASSFQGLNGLYIGGGFPEDYASTIESAHALQF
ncbi:MAG: cobyrinate a,c-diamide synthase, partial [Desulfovibrio sp.]|nr:cobyrinate a,c-diamide synthase [Desulfovibrio sp.]